MAKKERRTRQMQIRLTESEYQTLENVAGHWRKSEYVRQAVLEKMSSEKGKVTD